MNICLFTKEEIALPLDAHDERAVHIKKILKKNVGDTFSAGIIEGQAGLATITKIGQAGDADEGKIYFSFKPLSDGKPLFPLNMIIGFPRPIQLKRLLRDMAALGVQSVRLAGTELGEKSYLKADLSKPEEIYKMLLDGTVQAAATHVPKIFVYKTLGECLDAVGRECKESDESLFVALDNVGPKKSLSGFLKGRSLQGKNIFAAIGSERGWSQDERGLLESSGFVRLGMGSRVMRTETAATVSASIILSEAGFLG